MSEIRREVPEVELKLVEVPYGKVIWPRIIWPELNQFKQFRRTNYKLGKYDYLPDEDALTINNYPDFTSDLNFDYESDSDREGNIE